MKVEQTICTKAGGWEPSSSSISEDSARLVLAFGATSVLKDKGLFEEIRSIYPGAHVFGCSTAGEIYGTQVLDETLVIPERMARLC